MLLRIFLLLTALHTLFGKESKTLVLIIASDDQPVYLDFQKSWKSYMHLDPQHFECYFLRGDEYLPVLYSIEGDTVYTRTKECAIPGMLNKTLIAFEAFADRLQEFDYVLRTNLSSFFVFPRLLEFMKTLPKNRCYCGIPHCKDHCIYPGGWACGAGMILSIDIVKLFLENKHVLFDRNYAEGKHQENLVMDDVVMGRFLHANHVPIIPSRYLEIYHISDWIKVENNIPSDIFHFRIRTGSLTRQADEPMIHSKLFSMFYQGEGVHE